MVNFEYYTPTRIIFGKDTEGEAGAHAKAAGAGRVLVVYGSPRVKQEGLLGRVTDSLRAAGLESVELGGVVPNPHLDLVYEGVALARDNKVDFVLGVGGGSVLDTAKAIAYGAVYKGDVWDFYAGAAAPSAALPVGAVLTIAAAGSEMSDSSVITNEKTGEKRGVNCDLGRPVFAIMNPDLTRSLPAYPTACGVADIMMHTLERYFTGEEPMQLTAGLAESLLRTVMLAGRVLSRQPDNYAARAELMWAGSLSHNGLMAAGGGRGDWACHQLAHEISGMFDTAHGAALTAVWGSWARHVYKQNPGRFARLAVNVLEVPDEGSEEELALAGIEELESYFWGLELPTTIAELELDVSDAQLHEMAVGCSRGGTRRIGSFQSLDEADMEAIYRAANTAPSA